MSDDPFVQWWGRSELFNTVIGKSASVEKYRVRKNAALVSRGGPFATPIAYFVSLDAARQFCDDFLGGVVTATPQEDAS